MKHRIFIVLVALAACDAGDPAGPDATPRPLRPHLAVAELRGPVIASPGHPLHVAFRYENEGDTIAPGAGEHRLYLSEDATLSSTDHLLAVIPAQVLGPGASVADSVVLELAGDVPVGAYRLLLELDATGVIHPEPHPQLIARADSAVHVVPEMDLDVTSITLHVGIVTAPGGEKYADVQYHGQARNQINPDGDLSFAYSVFLSPTTINVADTLQAIRFASGTGGPDGVFEGEYQHCSEAPIAAGGYFAYAYVIGLVDGRPVPDPKASNNFQRSEDKYSVQDFPC